MVFSSFSFLLYFLPVVLLFYFLTPGKAKNLILFIASLFFYSYGVKDHPAYLLLLVFSIFLNHQIAKGIARTKQESIKKVVLIIGLSYNFGLLFLFKYLDFFINQLNFVTNKIARQFLIPNVNLVLPIGISFYTFQISAYLIDVYRKEIKREPSLLNFGTYISMFPQLVAGPIVTYPDVQKDLNSRSITWSNIEEGMREFAAGLASKVLIANRIGGLWTQIGAIGYDSISTPLAWMGIFAFTYQIYFDFWGYSLMARGLGRMLGFDLPINFRYPYISRSVTEFWRRWHITLGNWFKNYVYIPLGGNRTHHIRNLFVVWLLTGLWHGASWNYLLWAMLTFLLILVEKKGLLKLLEKSIWLSHFYMFLIIPLLWSVFAITDLGELAVYYTRLFPFAQGVEAPVFKQDYVKYFELYRIPFILSMIFSTVLPVKIYRKWKYSRWMTFILVLIFWLCIYQIYKGMDDPFLYYQF